MTLRLNRRSEKGLAPYVPPRGQDWRLALRARAWMAPRPGLWARQTGRPWGVRVLQNPESSPISARMGVVTFAVLAVTTIGLLVVLHVLGVWV